MTNRPPLVVHGAQAGISTLNMVFNPARPYTGCMICGSVYQSKYDRNPVAAFEKYLGVFPNIEMVNEYATALRKVWSRDHAKSHSDREHRDLAASGRWATPEAAVKLAAYGIISLTDLVLDNEVKDALAKASAVPVNDVEE